jgi:ribose/xylose/arabinose/galactoside ABC-type transport system permease subunit
MSEFESDAAARVSADERLGHRGPIQRLLVSPEIGALIGAVLVWAFFWGNGDTFGTAGSTANFLDVAAPLGIMAIAVAMLMIGGEFDLSAGIMTGATGVFVALMARYFMGNGVSLFICIPAAFLMAGCVGWWNGTLVNRTGLPSFIVTLGTFFVIKGANLVFAKRINDKVNVSDIEDVSGYKFFKSVFAGEHRFAPFALRDTIFLVAVVVGAVLVVFALLEQSFIRKDGGGRFGLVEGVIGLAVMVGGILVLHNTDGLGFNFAGALVSSVGFIVAVVGFAHARYQPSARRHDAVPSGLARDIGIGVAAIVLAGCSGLLFDRNESEVILSWLPSWSRPVIGACAVLLGIFISVRAALPALARRTGLVGALGSVMLVPLVAMLLLVGSLAFLQLTTVQALRAIVMLLSGTFGFVTLLRARGRAGKTSTQAFIGIGMLIAAALVVMSFIVRTDSGATRFRTGVFSALVMAAVAVVANTLVEARHTKRTYVDEAADKLGRRTAVAGLLLAAIGMGVRLLFSDAVFRMSVLWWLLATIIGAFVLTKTQYGNWIFAVGGNKDAARSIGVPAARVKTRLFVTTSMAAAFVGIMTLMRLNSVQAQQGDGQEFEFIIAAVVGGNLLTGGYGSVVGASLGAIIMAVSKNGIPAAQWNQDGRFIFLGAVLLVAVLVNNYIRKKAQEAR